MTAARQVRVTTPLAGLALSVGLLAGPGAPAHAAEPYRCGGRAATIVGTGFQDDLLGTSGDDVIVGLGDRDAIRGLAGNDRICGGQGGDRVRGGAGDDVLRAHWGQTGGHNDTVVYRHSASGITIDLAKPRVTGQGLDDVMGFHRVVGSGHDDTVIGGEGTQSVDTLGGRDSVTVDSHVGFVRAGDGDDVVVGGWATDGGDGADRLYRPLDYGGGGNGPDLVVGTAHHDRLDGGRGVDVVRGLGGSDLLTASQGSGGVLDGGTGDDTLHGHEASADRLVGGPGSDTLNPGDRRSRGAAHLADDVLLGGAGTDTADYSSMTPKSSVRVDLTSGTATGAGDDALSDLENVNGGYGDDILLGGAGPNVLYGGSRTDVLRGRGGSDLLVPEGWGNVLKAGDDVVDGGPGIDTADMAFNHHDPQLIVDLEAGIAVGAGKDTVTAVENVWGTKFDDSVVGDDGDNRLRGRKGQDDLVGAAGVDTANGGRGSDTCVAETLIACELPPR